MPTVLKAKKKKMSRKLKLLGLLSGLNRTFPLLIRQMVGLFSVLGPTEMRGS